MIPSLWVIAPPEQTCQHGQRTAAEAQVRSTREQIAEWLSGNICRCGAYGAIAESILETAQASTK